MNSVLAAFSVFDHFDRKFFVAFISGDVEDSAGQTMAFPSL